MSIDIIPINGKSQYFDYDDFEKSVIDIIGKKCSDAKIFLFNNFPALVSVEANIDLILIIAVEDKKGNFYIPKSSDSKFIYFYNQIIPIKFVTQFQEDSISFDERGRQIIVNEGYIDYSAEIKSIKSNLINYLSNKCGLKREELYVQPLIFIQNKNEFIYDNYLVAESFNFKSIHKYFAQNNAKIFIAYKDWKTELGYQNIATDIERITNQASKDSEIGYLTRKKIERIGRQLSSSRIIFEELNENLIIIEGKAGTGKSSELLLVAMKCMNKGQNALYLTYNKLLNFDIAQTIKSYRNANNNSDSKPGEVSILTLHAFFYRLSMSLSVLHVLSAERIEELLGILKIRMRQVYDIVKTALKNKNLNYDNIKSLIQNHSTIDRGTKEVGIDFLNFLQKGNISSSGDELDKASIDFFNHKKRIVENIEASDVFLVDYYKVLENTLLAIQTPEKFYERYKVEDKYELLNSALNLSDKYVEEKGGKKTITEKGFIEFKNRHVGARKRRRTLFIDEAQDCHSLERDILISIYGSNNIVVANGGKEQLIRHVELCNWKVSQRKNLNVKKHYTSRKSYRAKNAVIEFCNYIAKQFHVDLNLEPSESEDEGELLFDFRQHHNEYEVTEIFNRLKLKGKINGCSLYETLLILLEKNELLKSNAQRNELLKSNAHINEYGNIEDETRLKHGTWRYLDALKNNGFMFWDGTVDNKSLLLPPSPNESRCIYYESCRGLEAWTVACFALDKFFSQKREDPDAEKYLIEEIFVGKEDTVALDNEQRKSMYAATWALMALTRTIDTLYIQINDRNSEFGKKVVNYLKDNKGKQNVREIGRMLTNNINE
jgi:hypothetical protein